MPKDVVFNHSAQQWDYYKRFHVVTGRCSNIVQFDTGELIVRRWQYRPHERNCADKFGIVFLYAHDRSFLLKQLYDRSNGVCVRPSWLWSQSIMVDTETKQVMSLSPAAPRMVLGMPEIPEPIAALAPYAYCSGASRKWVSTGRIGYSQPAKLDKAQREELKEKLVIVQTQLRVGAIELHHRNYDQTSWPYCAVDYGEVLGTPLESISSHNRAVLAKWGYAPFRNRVTTNELEIV